MIRGHNRQKRLSEVAKKNTPLHINPSPIYDYTTVLYLIIINSPCIVFSIYKPVNKASLLSEDEEKLVKIQETEILEHFGRKSKSPEPSSKSRKLSVDEVSPPVPKRRKKKPKTDVNNSDTDIYKSFSCFDVSEEPWQQPIEQKDHWGLPPGLKANNGRISLDDFTNSQTTTMNYKTKGTHMNYF